MDYEPVVFLRCHSRNKDSADVQTQVWYCAFEPRAESPGETSSVVATCGGNSLCFVDCRSGQVLSKYYAKDVREQFLTLAWTTVRDEGKRVNLVAAGGRRATLHVVDRALDTCVVEHPLRLKSSVSVHSLAFHPSDSDVLFCGSSDGSVRLVRVEGGRRAGWTLALLSLVEASTSELFDTTFCSDTGLLVASSDDGLVAFPYAVDDKTDLPYLGERRRLRYEGEAEGGLVDSVEAVGGGMLAFKPALEGRIYVSDLREVGEGESRLRRSAALVWSPTDNYFMYMGFDRESRVLACGDDRGSVWLYTLPRRFASAAASEDLLPTAVLPWPSLTDRSGDRKRKLRLGVYDVVVDKVALASRARFLVAVTDNNTVCIWKRVDHHDTQCIDN